MSARYIPPKLLPSTKRKIIEDYQAGMGMNAIGKKYGLGHERRVKPYLVSLGVQIRKVGWKTGPEHHAWAGGKEKSGYWAVRVSAEDPLYLDMAWASGYVLEHRLIMARYLGRPLTSNETVHHLDGNTMNNVIENLQLRQGKHGKGILMRCMDCGSHNVQPNEL